MDKNRVFKTKDGQNIMRADQIFNLNIDTHYIDPNYALEISNSSEINENGLLIVFKIKSKNGEGPYFLARWDENQKVIDIDIYGISLNAIKSFKAEKKGYSGHHPIKISESPRQFEVNIKLPGFNIFKGRISFNINTGHSKFLF